MTATDWLHWLAVASVAIGVGSCLFVIVDIARGNRQHMHVMEWVWAVTALWSGLLGLYWYFRLGRPTSRRSAGAAHQQDEHTRARWQASGMAAFHCGAGCTLGDILAESMLIVAPFSLFGHEIFAGWVVDFVFAFVIGIVFQYFTIAPMRKLGFAAAIRAAVKADTLSLTSWQIGMYGWMAIATFVLFDHSLDKTGPLFWFMMQIAMMAGFLTAYPTNWWLLHAGIKAPMH